MTWYYPTLNSSFRGTIANYSFWTILVLICCLFYNLVWYRFVRFNCCCSQFELITWCKFMLYVCASFFELLLGTQTICQIPWVIVMIIHMKAYITAIDWCNWQSPVLIENLIRFGSFPKETFRMLRLYHIYQNLICGYRNPPLDMLLVI